MEMVLRPRRLAARVALAAVMVLVAGGCRVDAHVRVSLRDGGAGLVSTSITLDGEAVAEVERNGRTLESAILLDDLRTAGWEVAWEREGSQARLVLRHAFSGEDELNVRLGELAGSTGVVRDGRIVDSDGFVRSREAVSFTGDLSGLRAGIGQDEALAASLRAAGLDVDALEQQFGAALRDAVRLRITAQAPGGALDTVTVEVGEERRASAARSTFDVDRIVLLAIAGILAFLGGLLYVGASMSARRDRARRARPEPERHPLM